MKYVITSLYLSFSCSWAVAEINFSTPPHPGIHFTAVPPKLIQAGPVDSGEMLWLNSELKPMATAMQRYEFRGSLNNHPVYLNLEDAGQSQVVGFLWDSEGGRCAVHGEWYQNTLQLYDQANNWINVIRQ